MYDVRPMHVSARTMCLAVQNDATTAGADVVQLTCSGSAGQRWLVRSAGTGVFQMLPQTGTNLCLDVSGASTAAGGDLIQWTCHSGANQRFRIEP